MIRSLSSQSLSRHCLQRKAVAVGAVRSTLSRRQVSVLAPSAASAVTTRTRPFLHSRLSGYSTENSTTVDRSRLLHSEATGLLSLQARKASTAAANYTAWLFVPVTLALIAWLYRPQISELPASLLSSKAPMTIPLPQADFPPCPPLPTAKGEVKLALPPTEDRPHRFLVLPNGLEVVLISDPKADKAAASMDVGVGHLSDPDDLPGCAHFCEHLMFMGTKTYPSENEYSKYLSSNNGASNAWTAMTSTNYFFDVAPEALEGALDRFSGFFIEPLFAEDCTEREINAVNSEHKKNIQHDLWRFFQLEKSLSKPGHVYGKFGTGNLETLWEVPKADGRDPRDQLIKWWEHHYCARRMKLAVAGREDLDTLERMVREKFDKVPVRTEGRSPTGPDGVRVTFEDAPYGPDMRGVVTFAQPVRDMRALEVSLPVPDLHHFSTIKPYNFMAHFLGHEGKGSVLSYLKRQGWVNSLRAGASHEATGFGFFKVTVELTEKGLEEWKNVALAIFKYMALLRNNPPSETAFNEIRQLSDISYKFHERQKVRNYVTALTGWMQSPVERKDIVAGQYLLGDFDPKWLSAALQLLDPSQALIGITAKEIPKDVNASFDKKEKIYGTPYHVEKLPEEFIADAMAGAPIPDLHLPGPNPFVPERLDVVKKDVTDPAERPELLSDSEVSRLWFKQDDRFWVPKTNVYVEAHSPLLEASPRTAVLARLLCDLYNDAIVEDVYDAELAELGFHLWYGGDSLNVAVTGFTDKQALLLETMLQKLVNFEVDPERFDKVVDQIKLHWKNFELSEPYHVAMYWHSYVSTQVVWTQKEKLAEIEHITPADVQAYARELFQRLYFETLVHGNTTAAEAKSIQEAVEKVLHPRALVPAEKIPRRALQLPENSQHVWELPVANPSEPNNCVIYYTHTSETTDPAGRARTSLLGQIVSEPAFNVLRTKEQLGYVTNAAAMRNGLRVLVQSERDPVYVESRIETFLESLKELIEEMPEDDFERHKQSLIAKREEKPKNLSEESRRYWQRIADKYYEFGKWKTDVAELKKITKADLLEFTMKWVHPSSPSRRKLSVHMRSQFKGAKFDPASAEPIIAAFTQHGVAVDQAALSALVESKPELAAVKEFAQSAVEKTEGLSSEVISELKTLIDGLQPLSEPATEAKLRDGNVIIEDIHAFKAGLTPAKAAVPLEPLVPSKL